MSNRLVLPGISIFSSEEPNLSSTSLFSSPTNLISVLANLFSSLASLTLYSQGRRYQDARDWCIACVAGDTLIYNVFIPCSIHWSIYASLYWRRHAVWHRRPLKLGAWRFVLRFGEGRSQVYAWCSFGWSCLILANLGGSWQILSEPCLLFAVYLRQNVCIHLSTKGAPQQQIHRHFCQNCKIAIPNRS